MRFSRPSAGPDLPQEISFRPRSPEDLLSYLESLAKGNTRSTGRRSSNSHFWAHPPCPPASPFAFGHGPALSILRTAALHSGTSAPPDVLAAAQRAFTSAVGGSGTCQKDGDGATESRGRRCCRLYESCFPSSQGCQAVASMAIHPAAKCRPPRLGCRTRTRCVPYSSEESGLLGAAGRRVRAHGRDKDYIPIFSDLGLYG